MPLAIRMDFVAPRPFRDRADVKIVWKGKRIAKLIFPSGKVVEFDEPLAVEEKGMPPASSESGK